MCGRFILTSPQQAIREAFGLEEITQLMSPRYNIAPGQLVSTIRGERQDASDGVGRRRLIDAFWGFRPSWMAEEAKGPRPINARGETVADKPMFRDAFRLGRCIVPMTGFYEWSRLGGPKRPFLINRSDSALMAVGAICAVRSGHPTEHGPVISVAVVTTPSIGAVAELHDRMPLILESRDIDQWLLAPPDIAATLIMPSSTPVTIRPVSTRVNAVRNDDPGVLDPEINPPSPTRGGRNRGKDGQGELF